MSIVSLASYNSQSRGYDYFKEKKVLQSEQMTESTYHGIVSGSSGEQYDVTIDIAHPRRSNELEKTIRKMKKAELREALMGLLSDCTDWQYDRFVRTYVNLDD